MLNPVPVLLPDEVRTADAAPLRHRLWLPPQTAGGLLLRMLLLAALYCATGWAALQLAQPPGYATPIWPPSGIMLAFLLLWGRRVWPGVWLGSFAVNIAVGYAQHGAISSTGLAIAALIACGSTLEGLVGARLVRRHVQAPTRLETGIDVRRFFLIGGVCASALAAAIGTGTLLLLGNLPLAEAGDHALTWWIGDAIGVFLVAPLLLVWGGDARPLWRQRVRVVALSVLLSVAAGAFALHQANRVEQHRIRAAFDEAAVAIDAQLSQQLDAATGALATLADYFAASDAVEPAEFARIAGGLAARAPALEAVGWVGVDPLDGALKLRHRYPETAVLASDALRPPAQNTPRLWLRPMPRDAAGQVAGLIATMPSSAADAPGYAVGTIRFSRIIGALPAAHAHDAFIARIAERRGDGGVTPLFASSSLPAPDHSLRWQAEREIGGRHWLLEIEAGAAYLQRHHSLQTWLTEVGVLMFSALLGAFLLVLTGRSARVEQLVAERTAELDERNRALREEFLQRQRSEASFRGIFESATTGIAFTTRDIRILRCNTAFCALVGRSEDELLNLPPGVHLTHPDDRPAELLLYRELCEGKRQSYRLEKRFVRPDGSVIWTDAMMSALRGDGASNQYFVAVVIDITERRAAERRLELSGKVFEHIGEGVIISDADKRIVQCNLAFTQITGYPADEVAGQALDMLSAAHHDAGFYEALWHSLDSNGSWHGEVWLRRKNGEIYPAWLSYSRICDAQGVPLNYIAVFSDISERKSAEEQMRFLAQMDALTHLPNRYLLADRLQQALGTARRSRQPFAVMFIDIDRFKNINDSLGHGIGDALLKEVAQRLRDAVRASDTVARHGGDEFVIVVPDVQDVEQVAQLARKLLDAIARPLRIEQHLLSTSGSIGIALYPADADDVESLMKHADAAMYAAKSAGRNAFRFFTPDMNRRVQVFLSIENELRLALQRDELRVHYQPQIDVVSGMIVGAEALVRWQHPQRGLILPGEFIHVAEESGLIDAIGDFVLHEACRQSRAWQDAGLRAIPVAVNLSAGELHRGDPVARVERVLRATGLAPELLELEVTESMVMQDPERVGTVLERLRQMGVMIALDDFGTGYSSLAHLRRFPLSALKVDRSFVRDLQTDGNDAAICRAVIALGKSLGLRVVGEGVETREQLAFLRANRCDAVQGALFSWAVPPEAFAAQLRATAVDEALLI